MGGSRSARVEWFELVNRLVSSDGPPIPEKSAAGLNVKERVVEAERLTKLVPDKVHTWPYLVRLEMLVGTMP
jgi:hypothetical protein